MKEVIRQSHSDFGELINQARVTVIYLWVLFKCNISKAFSELCRCPGLQGNAWRIHECVLHLKTHGISMSLKRFSTPLERQCLYVNHHYLNLFHTFSWVLITQYIQCKQNRHLCLMCKHEILIFFFQNICSMRLFVGSSSFMLMVNPEFIWFGIMGNG